MSKSHYDVVHDWAHDNYNRDGEINGCNVFARQSNRAVYSYGFHFCMVRFTDSVEFPLFVNYNTYSVSTSKHQSYMHGAISHYKRQFECNKPDDLPIYIYQHEVEHHLTSIAERWVNARDKVNDMIERIDKRRAKGKPDSDYLGEQLAKLEGSRDYLLQEIRDRSEELERFRKEFKIQVKDVRRSVRLLRDKFIKGKWMKITEQQARAAEREAKRRRKAAEQQRQREIERQKETLEKWLNGEDVHLYSRETFARMRVKGRELQTSQGARVHVIDAAKAISFIKIKRKFGKTWRRNGETFPVGAFQMDEITDSMVRIGCHRFTFEEIDRIEPAVNQAVKEVVES